MSDAIAEVVQNEADFMAESFKYPVFATKAARELWVRGQLATPQWAVWGLMTIFAYQTADEQSADTTAEHNDVGFTGVDASLLSSFAKQWQKKNYLSEKQVALLLKKMPKYAVQLISHLESKGVTLTVDKKAAKLAEAEAALSTPVAPVDEVVAVGPSVLFDGPPAPVAPVAVAVGTPPPAKAGEPDWVLYRKLLGMSYKAADPAVAQEYVGTVQQYIVKADAFANDVWETISHKVLPAGKIPSYKQGKIIAIACAKASAGLSAVA